MKRIHIVAATVAALAVFSGGALYVRSSSAESKPAAVRPQALPVPVAVITVGIKGLRTLFLEKGSDPFSPATNQAH